jgi:hypothetical protein
MKYDISYLFQSVLYPELNIVKVVKNIDTKTKKYWFFINTIENTISPLEIVNTKRKDGINIRGYKDSKFYFTDSIGLYEDSDNRGIYINIPNVSSLIKILLDMYFD